MQRFSDESEAKGEFQQQLGNMQGHEKVKGAFKQFQIVCIEGM